MSRQEAIDILRQYGGLFPRAEYEAIDIAIEALRDIEDIERIIERNRNMCETDQLYIKIYVDSEPDTKAEKLYQICTTDELVDIMSYLQEYCKCEEL